MPSVFQARSQHKNGLRPDDDDDRRVTTSGWLLLASISATGVGYVPHEVHRRWALDDDDDDLGLRDFG